MNKREAAWLDDQIRHYRKCADAEKEGARLTHPTGSFAVAALFEAQIEAYERFKRQFFKTPSGIFKTSMNGDVV